MFNLVFGFFLFFIDSAENGCAQDPPFSRGKSHVFSVHVEDPQHEKLSKDRTFAVYAPESYDENVENGVIFWLHGQNAIFDNIYSNQQWESLSSTHNFIVIYPKGSTDCPDFGCRSSWNYGSNSDESTCDEGTKTNCYESCSELNMCSRCSWSSCYNEYFFFTKMKQWVSENYCTGNFVISGLSNGGMMTYSVSHGAPEIFDAYMPVQGLDLMGYLSVPDGVSSKPILHTHARSDGTIPVAGGTAKGYHYVSLEDAMKAWAENHGCDAEPQEMETEWSHRWLERNLECKEYVNCNAPVAYCLHDGIHGSWPSWIESLQVWWLTSKAGVLLPVKKTLNSTSTRKISQNDHFE